MDQTSTRIFSQTGLLRELKLSSQHYSNSIPPFPFVSGSQGSLKLPPSVIVTLRRRVLTKGRLVRSATATTTFYSSPQQPTLLLALIITANSALNMLQLNPFLALSTVRRRKTPLPFANYNCIVAERFV